MTDRLGKPLRKGDCVRYWHKVDGKAIPEIGEFMGITTEYNLGHSMAIIDRKTYNNTNTSYRTSSGLTKMTKAEGVLWKFDQFADPYYGEF